jgi:hypothetical protein
MMRLFFRRRRMSDFADAIRPELEAIPTPEPTEQLLERILASRAATARVILPEPVTPRSRVPRRAIVAIAVAAVALLMLVPSVHRAPSTGEDVFASSGFLAREAFAQSRIATAADGYLRLRSRVRRRSVRWHSSSRVVCKTRQASSSRSPSIHWRWFRRRWTELRCGRSRRGCASSLPHSFAWRRRRSTSRAQTCARSLRARACLPVLALRAYQRPATVPGR